MIDTLMSLLFRCSHRRLTRPFTPVTQKGLADGDTYVVCLDCGKQFAYDLREMRIGKVIAHSHDACVVPKGMAVPSKRKVKYAVAVALPVAAVVIGTVLKSKKSAQKIAEGAVDDRSAPAQHDPSMPPQGK